MTLASTPLLRKDGFLVLQAEADPSQERHRSRGCSGHLRNPSKVERTNRTRILKQ